MHRIGSAGKPFRGQGLVPEAVQRMLCHAFRALDMAAVWCGYDEGNIKLQRVQEKCGFVYHHIRKDAAVPLLCEVRTEQVSRIPQEQWEKLCRD